MEGQPLGVPFTLGLKHTLKYEVEVGLYFPRSWEFEEIPTWERLKQAVGAASRPRLQLNPYPRKVKTGQGGGSADKGLVLNVWGRGPQNSYKA